MTFPASLLPHNTPKSIEGQGSLRILQERILQGLLLSAFVFELLALAAAVTVGGQHTISFALIVLLGLLTVTALCMLLREFPYPIRAGALLAVLFFVGMQSFFRSQISLTTVVFFYAILFYAGALFNWQISVVALIACLAAFLPNVILSGGLSPNSLFPFQVDTGGIGSALYWTLVILIGISFVICYLWVANEYRNSRKNEKQAVLDLKYGWSNANQRIQEQTLFHQRRLLQAQVAAEISRSILSILDLDKLFQAAVELILDRLKPYYIGVYILDNDKKYAILKAGSGEAGRKMLADGHHLLVGESSLAGQVISHKSGQIALDAGSDNSYLPYTRSVLALPILSKGEVLGAITLHSVQPKAFDTEDITIMQGIADSLGTAIDNALLYQQMEMILQESRAVNQNFAQNAWRQTALEHGDLAYSFINPAISQGSDEKVTHEFPIVLRDHIMGYVTFESGRPELTREEKAFVDAVTTQTALALENARLLEETQRHAFEEQKLNEISEKFSQATNIEDILKSLVLELGDLPSVEDVSIHLVPPELESQSGNGHHPNGNNGLGRNQRHPKDLQ
jgi:GAF domain-containing protein